MTDLIRKFDRISPDSPKLENFIHSFLGLPCSHFWRGYGSCMFLEFGDLHENGFRRDGSRRNLKGDWTLRVECGWRIEGKKLIWCGSWSNEEKWFPAFSRFLNKRVASAQFHGRLPEIDVQFAGGLHLVSLMTAEGDPQWSLTKQCPGGYDGLSSRLGGLVLETCRGYERA